MSEQELHEHEFLLLLLDLAEGAPRYSDQYYNIEAIQEKFSINEENKYDIIYTIEESDAVNNLNDDSKFMGNLLNSYLKEKQGHRMWPFNEENE